MMDDLFNSPLPPLQPVTINPITVPNNWFGGSLIGPVGGAGGGGGGSGYLNTTTTMNASWTNSSVHGSITGGNLAISGDASFSGDVTIKGKSIKDSLERIEERLAILRPNEELEEKWEKLRSLRQMYMELEAEIIEKEKIWKILQK